MSDYASLCFLSYNRPNFIFEAISSAKAAAGYPCEVIVHDDGSDPAVTSDLADLVSRQQISRLILNPEGHNEGVGTAFNRAAGVSTGDPVVKLDQDLMFMDGWLRATERWLRQDTRIGMTGLFRYAADPVDWRKMNHRAAPGGEYDYVDDFVGSAMVIPRRVLENFGPFPEHSDAFAEDVEYKKGLQAAGLELALPREDLAINRGFGPGPSTVVYLQGGDVRVSKIQHGTTVFNV